MPGISQTILAKRMHDDPDRLQYPGFSGKKTSEDDRILIAMPALVYEIEVKELVDENNIFVSTVTQLARIKRKEINSESALQEYISQKTGLSKVLIKAILKEEELNTDVNNGTEHRIPQRSIRRIAYNPLSESFYPNSISEDTFDICSKSSQVRIGENEIELQFRLHESRRWESAFILHTDTYSEDHTLRNPSVLLDRNPGLRQKLFRTNIPSSDIYYTGQCQAVSALCYCYLSENDLSTLHLSNPIGHGDIDVMLSSIFEMLKKYPKENEELIYQIELLESSRKEKLETAGDWDQQLAEQEKETRLQYPKLVQFSSMLNRVNSLKKSLADSDQDNIIIAFHEFLEEILLFSCKHNTPQGAQWDEYDERCKKLETDGDKMELLVGFAEEAGFISNDEERKIALKCFSLKGDRAERQSNKEVISDYETDTTLVGVTFSNTGTNTENRQDIIRSLLDQGLLKNGQKLKLEPEPDNPHDENAIKVIGPDDRQIGSISKLITPILMSRIRNGEKYEATVTKVKGGNGFNYGIDIHISGVNPQIAKKAGSPDKKGNIRKYQLKMLLQGSENGGSNLLERLAANIIQSVINPNHPFRLLASTCHDIVSTVYFSSTARRDAKHDNEVRQMFTSHVSRDVMERTTDILLRDIMGIERLSGEALVKERDLRLLRQKAKINAENQIGEYPLLRSLKGGVPLEKVCIAYWNHDNQYISKCSNLLDKVISEILSEKTEFEQRKKTAANFFSGDRKSDADKMCSLFLETGFPYQSEDRPNTGKIKANWNLRTLTLKNKLFLCFATLYTYNREYLDKIAQSVPEIASIVDDVCIERGHSNLTDFTKSDDGYQIFHSRLLNCCERLYQIVVEQ